MPFLLPLLLAAPRRLPTSSSPAAASARARARRCSTPIVIDRDRLTGSASGRLEEVLRDVPGFQLFRRSDSRSANPTSQGATLRALGGNASSRVLLLLDGVPQTDPFGGWVSWPAYHPERLGEARVTRGGGSGVQGPGALAGTIELASATPGRAARPAGAARLRQPRRPRRLCRSRPAARRRLPRRLRRLAARRRVRPDRPRAARPRRPAFPLRADEPRGARGRAASGRRPSCRRAAWPFPTSGSGGPPSPDIRTRGRRRLASAGRAAVERARLCPDPRFLQQLRQRQCRAGRRRTAPPSSISVPATGLGARLEARPKIGPGIELRLGGDWRLTEGETRELFAFVAGAGTRGRVAGGRTQTLGGFAEAALDARTP